MGMSDQYDDGRYDSDVHNAYLDRANRYFNGEAYTTGGRRIALHHFETPPDVQAFIDLPITARRGGLQYPKGTPVTTPKKLTPKQKVRKIESELDANLELQQVLKAEEVKLRHDLRLADVPSPPPATAGDMFRVIVQFGAGQQEYTYLLARSGIRWFTTGTKEDQKVFENWEALCTWLNTTYRHSPVQRLVSGKTSWPTEHTDEVPF